MNWNLKNKKLKFEYNSFHKKWNLSFLKKWIFFLKTKTDYQNFPMSNSISKFNWMKGDRRKSKIYHLIIGKTREINFPICFFPLISFQVQQSGNIPMRKNIFVPCLWLQRYIYFWRNLIEFATFSNWSFECFWTKYDVNLGKKYLNFIFLLLL